MAFFTEEEKFLGRTKSTNYLKKMYEQSEKRLQAACKTGKIRNIEKSMKYHHKWEYALLYKKYAKSR